MNKKHDWRPMYGNEVIYRADVAKKIKGRVIIERFGKKYTLFLDPHENTGEAEIYAYGITKLLS